MKWSFKIDECITGTNVSAFEAGRENESCDTEPLLRTRYASHTRNLAGFVVATCDGEDTIDGCGIWRIAVSCEPRTDRSVCKGSGCVAQLFRIGGVE
ncbi:MAG: hypothetical protein ACJAXA_003106 [Candidatus Aldehydirespiratoraceae bacterium]